MGRELGPLVGYRDPDDPKRTLVIESVSQQDGKWVASGRFGVTGKRLARVPIEVGRSGARPSIRFSTAAGSTIRLDLLDERNLGGTFTTPGSGQRDRARPLKLQKVD